MMLDPEALKMLRELSAGGYSMSWVIRDAIRRHYFALKKTNQRNPQQPYEEQVVNLD
jgi:hypothetical protein